MEQRPNSAGTETQEQFGIQNIYVKDISFEAPNSPQIFMEQWKPQLSVEMTNDIKALENNMQEVVLNITATVKVGEKTAFLIEVRQAGIFTLIGFSQDKLEYMLNSFCPNILFPYARETISNIVIRGGFHPLLLAPVNFDAAYAQKLKQTQSKNTQENKKTVN
ncbi:MAG: protein-export chaperone SecB [Pseudomonadota bacterium]|nr:protein-export chaperone SecB [Pseudomonadota bacterium]